MRKMELLITFQSMFLMKVQLSIQNITRKKFNTIDLDMKIAHEN